MPTKLRFAALRMLADAVVGAAVAAAPVTDGVVEALDSPPTWPAPLALFGVTFSCAFFAASVYAWIVC